MENQSHNQNQPQIPHRASPHVVDLRLHSLPKPAQRDTWDWSKYSFAILPKLKAASLAIYYILRKTGKGISDGARELIDTFALPFKFFARILKTTLGSSLAVFKHLTTRTSQSISAKTSSIVGEVRHLKDTVTDTKLIESVKNLSLRKETSAIEEIEDEVRHVYESSDEYLLKNTAFGLRPWLGFVTVLFILILPLKGFSYFKTLDDLKDKIVGSTTNAISDLKKASDSAGKMNFKDASQDFSQASASFLSAKQELDGINSFFFELAKIIPNDQVKFAASSQHILTAGELGAKIGADLSLAIDGLLSGKEQGLIYGLDKFSDHGKAAQLSADLLLAEINQIDNATLPLEYRDKFVALKTQANFLSENLKEVVNLVDKLKILVGAERDTRYLLVFQNNAEMRASGGFFGSYALLDFSKGKIKNIETPAGGTYDVEAAYKERIVAPTPLWLVNPLWHFWDANWWYDWPTTANKLMWFYEKSGGATVDGVISLTPTTIENILVAIGPIDLQKDYGVTLDSKNFWEVTQTFAEQKPSKTKKPKKIIGDLINEIKDELPKRLNKEVLFALLKTTEQSLNQKHVLFYFKNEDLEKFVADNNWDGRVKQSNYDYLAVINTNIAGGKSDRKIEQEIIHNATVMSDGSIIDNVEIVRRNTADPSEQFVGMRNIDWVRVYVPEGAELIEATGFLAPLPRLFEQPDPAWKTDPDLLNEDVNFKRDALSGTKIYNEFGKTVFANWLIVDPGKEIRANFKYKLATTFIKEIKADLPAGLNDLFGTTKKVLPYALMVQKQPGEKPIKFTSSLNIQPLSHGTRMSKLWQAKSLEHGESSDIGWHITSDLVSDQNWAILYEQKD